MADRADFAVAAQGAAPLTAMQIRALAVEARRAYMAQRKLGLADDDFDTWRHAAIVDAVPAARGLRDLTQRDFAAVRSWLRELAGGRRSDAWEETEADKARRARWALRRAMDRRRGSFPGSVDAYVDSLFAKIHGTTAEKAAAKQIWAVVFTLKNRGGPAHQFPRRGEKAVSGAGNPRENARSRPARGIPVSEGHGPWRASEAIFGRG